MMLSLVTYEPFLKTSGFTTYDTTDDTFHQCRNALLKNRNDLAAISNYISFLQHYIFSIDYSFSSLPCSKNEIFNNKRDAALMIIDAADGFKNNKILYPEYLSLIGQCSFIAGRLGDSLEAYVKLLNQDGLLDVPFARIYNGELESAARVCHNICFLYSIMGASAEVKKAKERFKTVFTLESGHAKRIKNDAIIRDKSIKDLARIDKGMKMEVFFYDALLDSNFISSGMTMLNAVYMDALKANTVYIPRYDFTRNVKWNIDGYYTYDDAFSFDPTTPEAKIMPANNKEPSVFDNVSPSQKPQSASVKAETSVPNSNEVKTLEDLLNELNGLTGLKTVKNEVTSIINLLQLQNARRKSGLSELPVSNHLVFSGNPGTGKTTVARLIAQIYHKLGVLSKGQLIEVDRSGLVGGYVGQTALKTQEVIQKAIGGVLFIDEAYTLSRGNNSNDFGQEAIDTILKAMEDNRNDFVVIVAGYPELMNSFIMSNPGLKSRFNKYINFTDYTPSELLSIFEGMCAKAGCKIDEQTREWVLKHFQQKYDKRDSSFANAREVRNFFENAIINQANRLARTAYKSEDVATLTLEDVKNV